MNRPSSVRIGAKQYDISWSKKAWKQRDPGNTREDPGEEVGATNHLSGHIWIGPMLTSEAEKRATLMHEILHCIIWNIGLPMDTYFSDNDDDRTEENLVSALEPRLTAALADNPAVFAYISGVDVVHLTDAEQRSIEARVAAL